MLISTEYKTILFTEFKKNPVINLTDQEEVNAFDSETGEPELIPFKLMESLQFIGIDNHKSLLNKYNTFIKEIESNRLISGINLTQYINETLEEINTINIPFLRIELHGKEFLWRDDLILYHNSNNSEAVIISNYNNVPVHSLEKISYFFSIQKQIIEDSKNYLSKLLPKKTSSKYGTSYEHNYFKFDKLDHIGNNKEIREAKIAFFQELIDLGYINKNDQKIAHNYFNDISCKTKIKWLGTREELNYMIRILIKEEIIKNPKRETSRLIAKTFCSSEGNNYQSEMFHSLHDPNNTRRINQVIDNLR